MPRKPRFFLPNIPIHAIVRGNDRNNIFKEDADKATYLEIAKEASSAYDVAIHAYVLMDNHVHWLISCAVAENLSKFMQYLGRKYVPYFNHKYEKTGTLWEGRYKASLIDSDEYLFRCCQYIELNPVRAGMVSRPEHYVWSSYRANALGEMNPVVTPHPLYVALGDDQQRASVYRQMFPVKLDDMLLDDVRNAVQTGTPLGGQRFKQKIEKALGTKVGYSRRGRPPKRLVSKR